MGGFSDLSGSIAPTGVGSLKRRVGRPYKAKGRPEAAPCSVSSVVGEWTILEHRYLRGYRLPSLL